MGGGLFSTEIGAWQDRNGCLAGQKLELGRTEMEAWQNRIGKLEAWQKIICKTGRTAWQKSLVQHLGRSHGPPLAGRNFGRKGLNFGRMKL